MASLRGAVVSGCFCLLAGVHAQAPAFKKPKPKASVANSAAPVSQAEAVAVFDRVRRVIGAIGVRAGAGQITPSPKLVTRAAVVDELARIFEASRPQFRFTPKPLAFAPERLKFAAPESKVRAQRLVAWGLTAPLGPLVTGPGASLTVAEFGDAVGFFIARLSELTHLPSSKWTPDLQPN